LAFVEEFSAVISENFGCTGGVMLDIPLEPTWYLGVSTGNKFDLRTPVTKDEYDLYRESIMSVNSLRIQFATKLIEKNYQDLRNVRQYVGLVFSFGRAFAVPDRLQFAESVMALTINWLTSVRLYLDHAETDLKKRFGSTSAEWTQFKQECSSAYDESLGYRFVYKFRNYVQHCGMPVSHMSFVHPKGSTKAVIQDVQFLLDRDQLLNAYGDWGPVKTDLMGMSERFDLDPLIEEAMHRLRLIERTRLLIEIGKAAGNSDNAALAVKNLGELGSEESPYLIAIERFSDGRIDFSPFPIPINTIATLQKVKVGEIDSESLILPPSVPTSPLDPEMVRQRIHTDSRGVQAISLFLEQGGATPEFHVGMQRIIEEDNGSDQLMTGLLNVSLVMVYSAASALGVTAEGFLSGMLNIYTKPDEFETKKTD
jgi:hypothetical protein